MAEILVITKSTYSIDDAKNLLGWKRGQIVAVQDDKWVWGHNESIPNFIRVIVPDANAKEIEAYCYPVGEEKSIDGKLSNETSIRSKYYFPESFVDSTLRTGGKVELKLVDFVKAILDVTKLSPAELTAFARPK